MDVVVHVVALDGCPECSLDAVAVEADVERDRRRPGEQAVEMAIEMSEDAMVETDPLPDAVTDEETRIEDGDLGFVSREEVTVDVDLDRGVALVGEGLVRTSAHGQHARRSSPEVAASTWSVAAPAPFRGASRAAEASPGPTGS